MSTYDECDRCGKETGASYTLARRPDFGVIRSWRLCDNCDTEFVRWLTKQEEGS